MPSSLGERERLDANGESGLIHELFPAKRLELDGMSWGY
jgi:hypothetical protein